MSGVLKCWITSAMWLWHPLSWNHPSTLSLYRVCWLPRGLAVTVEDATAPLITFVLRQLEGIKNRAHRLFDFSSVLIVFSHVLAQLLIWILALCWFTDFLPERVSGTFSYCSSSTGSSGFFVLSIKKCRRDHASWHIPKYADDSVIVSLLHGSAHDHSPSLKILLIGVTTKTKEIHSEFLEEPCVIKGVPVAAVQRSRYLATVPDHKENFDENTKKLE